MTIDLMNGKTYACTKYQDLPVAERHSDHHTHLVWSDFDGWRKAAKKCTEPLRGA